MLWKRQQRKVGKVMKDRVKVKLLMRILAHMIHEKRDFEIFLLMILKRLMRSIKNSTKIVFLIA